MRYCETWNCFLDFLKCEIIQLYWKSDSIHPYKNQIKSEKNMEGFVILLQ